MSLSERTASDYAIEHAGYLARSVTAFLDLIGREAVFDEDAQQHLREQVSDHLQAMRSGVYEFEKRAARAEGSRGDQAARILAKFVDFEDRYDADTSVSDDEVRAATAEAKTLLERKAP